MNKTLIALVKKLNWQFEGLNQISKMKSEELFILEEKINALQKQLQESSKIPIHINPEQEILRLNFILRSQQEQEQLYLEKKELEAQITQLKERQIRLKIEIKMLENYQIKQKKIESHAALETLQKEQDERAFQRGIENENS